MAISWAGVPSATIKPAAAAALGAEVHQPVGGGDHVEVVLDDHQRVAGIQQLSKGRQQRGDVLEVQAGGGLVEQEEQAGLVTTALAPFSIVLAGQLGGFGQVAGELEALGLAAGEGGHRLAEAQVFEADVGQRRQGGEHGFLVGEEGVAFGDGHLQHVGHALPPRHSRARISGR